MKIPGSRRSRISRTHNSFAQSNFLAELNCYLVARSRQIHPGHRSTQNFCPTTWKGFMPWRASRPQSLLCHVHCDELPDPVHNTFATFFQQTRDNTFNRAVTVSLLICQELQGDDQVITHTLRCTVCSKNFSLSRRSSVSCMTKALFGALQAHWPP